MSQIEMKMPKMGESVAEATIIKWLKNEGDTIEAEEAVLEIATDKVDSEVPAPAAGKLLKRMFNEGDVVQVGSIIALIGESNGTEKVVIAAAAAVASPLTPAPTATATTATTPIHSSSNKFYSPLVRNIASQENISQAELDAIAGTGAETRVTKKDILAFVENKKSGRVAPPITTTAPAPPTTTATATATAPPASSLSGENEIIEMDRMRKLIADHMVMSKQTSPHVTSFVEVDVTNMVKWRDRVKKDFEKRENEKITFTPIFIEAVVKAIKDFPMINVSLDGTKIIIKKNINIGMAAALPTGNLIVPVIKNADRLNLLGLTKTVNDLANRARANKLTPDEIQGGTYTITNVGTFGNVMGTPIINQPQAAILALGAIRKKPAVLETEYGDVIAVRHMMFLSHSYDHRIVDGALGGSFVRRVADYLEQFDINREI
ncbi:MAG: dihydrolipoamide acetyltransferase family protein [Bacteroidia bacterium]